MRTHFVALGAFALAVVCSAGLGIATSPADESVSVRASNGVQILVGGVDLRGKPIAGHGFGGPLSTENGCVVLGDDEIDDYTGVVWPPSSRVRIQKGHVSVDSRLGEFDLGGDYVGRGIFGGPKQLDVPARVQATCPAKYYVVVTELTTPRGDAMEIKDAVLVAEDNGVASLAGTVINHGEYVGDLVTDIKASREGEPLDTFLKFGAASAHVGESADLGDRDYAYLVRDVKPGQEVRLTFKFNWAGPVSVITPVVANGSQYEQRLRTFPGAPPTLTDGRIVIYPGSKCGYVGYTIDGHGLGQHTDPSQVTAATSSGQQIAYGHQTATGGEAAIYTLRDKAVTVEPQGDAVGCKEGEQGGDADYVDATNLKPGDIVQVSMEFPTGYARAPFEVEAG